MKHVMVRCMGPGQPLPAPVLLQTGDTYDMHIDLRVTAETDIAVHFGHFKVEDAITPRKSWWRRALRSLVLRPWTGVLVTYLVLYGLIELAIWLVS